jgi:integrase
MSTKLVRGGKDSWTARITLPAGLSGRRTQKRLTFKGTKREAEAALERFKADLLRGEYANPGTATVSDLLDRWLSTRRERVERSTLERYETIVNHHLRPVLGAVRLSRLTPALVEEAVKKWKTAPRRDRKRGMLSQRTIHHLYSTLRVVLTFGVRSQMLARNPCALMERFPKGGRTIEGLSPRSIQRLFAGLNGTIVYGPSMVAAFGGLRRGEILGLMWTDLELQSGVLSVSRSLDEARDKSLRLKTPKTKQSKRPVVLPSFVLAELQRHRKEVEDHFGAGHVPEPLFPDWKTGEYWSPDALSSTFYHVVRTRKLPQVSFHGLRHTYSNLMQAAGVTLVVTSRAMGHSCLSTTGDVYTDVTPPEFLDAARRLDARYGKMLPAPSASQAAAPKPQQGDHG